MFRAGHHEHAVGTSLGPLLDPCRAGMSGSIRADGIGAGEQPYGFDLQAVRRLKMEFME